MAGDLQMEYAAMGDAVILKKNDAPAACIIPPTTTMAEQSKQPRQIPEDYAAKLKAARAQRAAAQDDETQAADFNEKAADLIHYIADHAGADAIVSALADALKYSFSGSDEP